MFCPTCLETTTYTVRGPWWFVVAGGLFKTISEEDFLGGILAGGGAGCFFLLRGEGREGKSWVELLFLKGHVNVFLDVSCANVDPRVLCAVPLQKPLHGNDV